MGRSKGWSWVRRGGELWASFCTLLCLPIWGRTQGSLFTQHPPPPAAVDKQGLNFHPEFPELSTLRQIGNLNFYMKSDFSVLTANSNV